MALSIDQIVYLYQSEGTARYGGEAIDQQQHALQCALLAQEAGASPELVAAALLHDLGHLLHEPAGESNRDELHEYLVLPFLRGAYPDSVLEPIRLHVAAKRYLCATDPSHWSRLSPASKHSLQLQGGVFSPEEADHFFAEPHAMDALALRRWDDLAKSPTRSTPGWSHYRRVLELVYLRRPGHVEG